MKFSYWNPIHSREIEMRGQLSFSQYLAAKPPEMSWLNVCPFSPANKEYISCLFMSIQFFPLSSRLAFIYKRIQSWGKEHKGLKCSCYFGGFFYIQEKSCIHPPSFHEVSL
jgi:hypothetical protein